MKMKLQKALYRKKGGSALLIAILVMGVLMILTLGLSDLVVREIRQTRDIVTEGKAYFAAEAGIENALLDLHENLPGHETPDQKYLDVEGSLAGQDDAMEDDFHYRYRILNTADKLPFFDPDKTIFLNPNANKVVDGNSPGATAVSSNIIYNEEFSAATYNVLALHESIVIPLSSDPDGTGIQDVQDFMVQYYFNFDKSYSAVDNADIIKNFDMLRWKIFGHPKTGPDTYDALKTDAISDFYPAVLDNGPNLPVCIGTNQDVTQPSDATKCIFPALSDGIWGAARECYLSDALSAHTNSFLMDIQNSDVSSLCTIQHFIETHRQNFLVLTNVVNPQVIGLTNLDLDLGKANIYYRVIAQPGPGFPKLVREVAAISADGFAGNDKFQQSIDVNIGLSSFLPVFHFSLYRTDSSL